MLRFVYRSSGLALTAVVISAGISGCAGSPSSGEIAATSAPEPASPDGRIPLELFTFWGLAGETGALDVLKLRFDQRQADAEVSLVFDPGSTQDFQSQLLGRFENGKPPDIFQANGGNDLFEWVLDQGVLAGSPAVAQLNTLSSETAREALHEVARDVVRYDGEFFGVPLDIHRNDSLFVARGWLDEHGFELPRDVAGLLDTCREIREKHPGVTPLALGTRESWTLHLLLEAVLLSEAGPEFYRDFWCGDAQPDAEAMELVLKRLLDFEPCLDPKAARRDETWPWGVTRVAETSQGQAEAPAVFALMGDWAKAYLVKKGYGLGEDFDVVPFPGNQDQLVATVDVLAAASGSKQQRLSSLFLQMTLEVPVQEDFNLEKGSIPARRDIDISKFDHAARSVYETVSNAPDGVVYALTMLLPRRAVVALDAALQQMFDDGEVETVRLMLHNYYRFFRAGVFGPDGDQSSVCDRFSWH